MKKNKQFNWILSLTSLLVIVLLPGCGGAFTKIIGVGVIIESTSNDYSTNSLNLQPDDLSWKKIDLEPVAVGTQPVQPLFQGNYHAASAVSLDSNLALALLAWDPVAGAGHYQVFFREEKVWDSDTVNSGSVKDPAYNRDKPEAYLDLDDELGNGKITESGQYDFKIVALNGTAVIAQSLKVTVSLGVYLQTYPEITGYNSPTLTWKTVNNATEYRIGFQGIGTATVKDAAAKTFDVSQKLTPSSSATKPTYNVWVDALMLDTGGNPAEISRGKFYTISY